MDPFDYAMVGVQFAQPGGILVIQFKGRPDDDARIFRGELCIGAGTEILCQTMGIDIVVEQRNFERMGIGIGKPILHYLIPPTGHGHGVAVV